MANPNRSQSQLADGSNNPMISDQQSLIADAETSHSITDAAGELDAANEAELEGFFDALGTKINAIIDVLEAHGLMSDS